MEIDSSQFAFFVNRIDEFRGKVVLLNKNKKAILPLLGINAINNGNSQNSEVSLEFMNLNTNQLLSILK